MNKKVSEHKVKEGTFIPDMHFNYPEKADDAFLHPKKVRNLIIDENYPFLDKSFSAKLLRFAVTLGIYTVVHFVSKIRFDLKIEGKQNLKKYKKKLKNGAMTICNHVHRWDFTFVVMATGHKNHFFPAKASNLETKDEKVIRGVGGIPIPSTIKAMHKFNEAFDEIAKNKKWIHFFAESTRWDYYEPIRPFKMGAFKMAYKYKYPIVPLAISYRKPYGIWKLLKVNYPLLTIKIGEPIFTDNPEKLPKNEYCALLRRKTHSKVCELAGIEQNCWEAEGD